MAAVTGGQAPMAQARPEAIKAIPIRHWGRWVSAAVDHLRASSALLWSLGKNPNVDMRHHRRVPVQAPLTLRGVRR